MAKANNQLKILPWPFLITYNRKIKLLSGAKLYRFITLMVKQLHVFTPFENPAFMARMKVAKA
ncbi:MAG TPA: hypothetical protein DEA99_08005 [Candidatus Omnitrophica bacterium]|nr:hypothetical protein [Candidatus Omnitrophota bacterium]